MEVNYDLFVNTLFMKAQAKGIPLSGSFELTSRCNLDCRMCYIHRRCHDREALAGERNADWWISLAEQAKEHGMLLLLLTGGEPLLRSDFGRIYTACKSLGLLTSVNTNGVLLDEDKLRMFREYPPQRVNISLYGSSPETYRRLCGNADAYHAATESIIRLHEAGIGVRINYSVTPDNVGDAAEIQAFAESHGLPVQATFHMFPPVRSCGEAVRLSPAEAAKAQYEWHLRRLGESELRARAAGLKPGALRECDPECGERLSCRAGSASFWVTWSGQMSPCGMMTEPSVPVDDFGEAWREIMRRSRDIYLPPECSGCDKRMLCDVCAAVSYSESGRFSGLPDYACRKAAEYKRLLLGGEQDRR